MKYKETDYHVKQDFDIESLDYSVAEKYKEFADIFSDTTDSCIFIFDYFKHNYFYIKSHNEYFCDIPEIIKQPYLFFNQKLHPEDVSFVYRIHHKAFSYVFESPQQARKGYKLKYNVRMIDNNNLYEMTDINLYLLETDKKGNIWLAMFVIRKSDKPFYSVPKITLPDQSFFYFNLNENLMTKLTPSEKTVAQMLMKNKSEKEVSVFLGKSLNTIKAHRKNIYIKARSHDKYTFQKKMLIEY